MREETQGNRKLRKWHKSKRYGELRERLERLRVSPVAYYKWLTTGRPEQERMSDVEREFGIAPSDWLTSTEKKLLGSILQK